MGNVINLYIILLNFRLFDFRLILQKWKPMRYWVCTYRFIWLRTYFTVSQWNYQTIKWFMNQHILKCSILSYRGFYIGIGSGNINYQSSKELEITAIVHQHLWHETAIIAWYSSYDLSSTQAGFGSCTDLVVWDGPCVVRLSQEDSVSAGDGWGGDEHGHIPVTANRHLNTNIHL